MESLELASKCSLWMEGVLMPIVGAVGLAGNLLSVAVLLGKEMSNSFNKLLITLTIFDTTFIVFMVIDYTGFRVWQWPFGHESALYAYVFPKFLFPLNNIALSCSIYTTVGIAYERYTAVCRPYSYNSRETTMRPSLRLVQILLPVLLISVVVNLPRFFEVVTSMERRNVTIGGNVTEVQEFVTYDITQLRMDPDYIRYYINWTRLLCTCLLPVFFLVLLNVNIFRGIRLSRKRSRGSAKKELNLASILVCIVVVFLVCNIPRVFINCYEFLCSENIVRDDEEMSPPLWILCFTSFNHLALVFNASVNFLIYFSCGNAFKQTLLKLVRVLPDLPRVTKPPDPSEGPLDIEIN